MSTYAPSVDLEILPNTPLAPPPIFSWIPQQCWPDNITAISEAYVLKVDPDSGNVLDGQWIDGSAPVSTAIALAADKVWITGDTAAADVPFSPGVLAPPNLGIGFQPGAFLSAVDFSGGVNTGPRIACVLDGGNLTHAGPVAAYQLLSIFGANLGPGVSITFNDAPAQLSYVSPSQINVLVPAPLLPPTQAAAPALLAAMVMQLTTNGVTIQRQFPYTLFNMNLFADLSPAEVSCPSALVIGNPMQPLAMNADGSVNSCTNPAKYGSTVSFFMHGVGGDGFGFQPPQQLGSSVQALVGYCPAAVTNTSLVDDFKYKVDVTMPASLLPCAQASSNLAVNSFWVTFSYNGNPVGPFGAGFWNGGPTGNFPNESMLMTVWVTE